MKLTSSVPTTKPLAAVAFLLLLLGSTTTQAQQWNPKIENLQVLPQTLRHAKSSASCAT